MSAFYDSASLVLVPSGYKSQKIYAQKPLTADGQLTFTRASNASRIGPDGLLEKVRTNLLTYSNDFSNAAWGKYGATLTAGQSDPDGGTSATKIALSAGGNYYIGQFNLGDSIKTNSVWLRADSPVEIGFHNGQTASVVTLTTSWVRYTITQTGTSSAGIQLDNYAGVATPQLAVTFYAYQAQNETGDIATDYIATTTAAVSVAPVANLPRLSYDPANPTCPSLLLEPQRTNLVTSSEFIDSSAGWTLSSVSVTDNATTSPEGVANASKITASANFSKTTSILSLSGSTTYTASFYVKDISAGSSTRFVVFDQTNSAVLKDENYSADISTTEWTRLSYSFTTTTAATVQLQFIRDLNSGEEVFVYGFQCEAGSYPTSYIPTYGTATTRAADECRKSGISSLIGQTEGTLFAEIYANENAASMAIRMRNSAGGVYGDFINIEFTAARLPLALVYVGGVSQVNISGSAVTTGYHKIAIAYKANDFALYVDGVQIATSSSGSVPACNELYIDQYFDGALRNTSKKQVLLFKTRLTNAQLAELTAL